MLIKIGALALLLIWFVNANLHQAKYTDIIVF